MLDVLRSADPALQFHDDASLWDLLDDCPERRLVIEEVSHAYPLFDWGEFPQPHLPATAVRALIGQSAWNEAFKFAFVRNPWDRLVSQYHFMIIEVVLDVISRRHPDLAELVHRSVSFSEYVKLWTMTHGDQTSVLSDREGNILVDFIGHFENLEDDFATVCRRIGLTNVTLPHINATQHPGYRDYYDDETRDLVARHYARDIDRFQYEF